MGNWTIVIKGTGCHHNPDLLTDANRMAAEFVLRLREAGHSVTAASIAYGSEDDLSMPSTYLDDKSPAEKKGPRCDLAACRLVKGHEGVCCPPYVSVSGSVTGSYVPILLTNVAGNL